MFTTAEEARLWKERWKSVNATTREETRRLTPEERLEAFYALMDMAREMKWHTTTPAEIEEVRRRWKKIKACRGKEEPELPIKPTPTKSPRKRRR